MKYKIKEFPNFLVVEAIFIWDALKELETDMKGTKKGKIFWNTLYWGLNYEIWKETSILQRVYE